MERVRRSAIEGGEEDCGGRGVGFGPRGEQEDSDTKKAAGVDMSSDRETNEKATEGDIRLPLPRPPLLRLPRPSSASWSSSSQVLQLNSYPTGTSSKEKAVWGLSSRPLTDQDIWLLSGSSSSSRGSSSLTS